jgi:hypothetical protein
LGNRKLALGLGPVILITGFSRPRKKTLKILIHVHKIGFSFLSHSLRVCAMFAQTVLYFRWKNSCEKKIQYKNAECDAAFESIKKFAKRLARIHKTKTERFCPQWLKGGKHHIFFSNIFCNFLNGFEISEHFTFLYAQKMSEKKTVLGHISTFCTL